MADCSPHHDCTPFSMVTFAQPGWAARDTSVFRSPFCPVIYPHGALEIGSLATSNLSKVLSSDCQAGDFTDLQIVFKGSTYKVHKAVVCTQSSVFKKMCTSGFKESTTNIIDLSANEDLDHKQLDALLFFLYTDEYFIRDTEPTGKPFLPFDFHAKMYALADCYDIPSLSAFALSQYEELLPSCYKIESELLASLDIVFGGTHESNKKLRRCAGDHIKKLMQQEPDGLRLGWLDQGLLRKALSNNPELGMYVICAAETTVPAKGFGTRAR